MKALVFGLVLAASVAQAQTDEVLVPSSQPPLIESVPDYFRIQKIRIQGGLLGRAPTVSISAQPFDSGGGEVNGGIDYTGSVTGTTARQLISSLNKADLSSNNLEARALTQLAALGVIPAGSVSQTTCPTAIVCTATSVGETCTQGSGPCTVWVPSGGTTVEQPTADYQLDVVDLTFGPAGTPEVTITAVPRVSGGGDCVRFGPYRECIFYQRQWQSDDAAAILADLSTNNGNTKTIRKRLLEKLRDDGALPAGSVTGTPFALPNQ